MYQLAYIDHPLLHFLSIRAYAAAMPSLSLPSFLLNDEHGTPTPLFRGRHALVAFVGEATPATNATLRLLTAAAATFGESMDIVVVQEGGGPGAMGERPGPHVTLLHDATGAAADAFALGELPAVVLAGPGRERLDGELPAVVLAGPGRERLDGWVGFSRKAWQALFARLITTTLQPAPMVEWLSFPPSAPAAPRPARAATGGTR